MNLHNIRPRGEYFWIERRGQRGTIGRHPHLWRLEPINRPAHGEPLPAGATDFDQRYWSDPYITWRPYGDTNLTTMRRAPWTAPLCGLTTAARRPDASFAYDDWNLCPNCTIVARERGIIGHNYFTYTNTDPLMTQLVSEQNAWSIARTMYLRERGIRR